MNLKDSERDQKMFEYLGEGSFEERFGQLIEGSHKIGVPQPIFREISNDEIQKCKEKFEGKKK